MHLAKFMEINSADQSIREQRGNNVWNNVGTCCNALCQISSSGKALSDANLHSIFAAHICKSQEGYFSKKYVHVLAHPCLPHKKLQKGLDLAPNSLFMLNQDINFSAEHLDTIICTFISLDSFCDTAFLHMNKIFIIANFWCYVLFF